MRQPTKSFQEVQLVVGAGQKSRGPKYLKIAHQSHAKASQAGNKLPKNAISIV